MYGWAGSLLNVDLSKSKVEKKELAQDFASKYVGGRGFSAKLILDKFNASVEPFDPQNLICISAGLLSGTMAPSSGRLVVSVMKSPLTGYFCDGNVGGFFGAEMAQAGYDAIMIHGKARKPVYIFIEDEIVEIKDASSFWGKDVFETTHCLQKEAGDLGTQILTIGPAGENLSKQAAVLCNLGRAAGAGGIGAVFGSKNLKAIAVKGYKGKQVADPRKFVAVVFRILRKLKNHPIFEAWSKYGTTMLPGVMVRTGNLTVKNWQMNIIDGWENLDGPSFYPRYVVRKKACDACPIHCSRFFKIPKGAFAGTSGEGPEYTSLMSLGVLLGITKIDAVLYLHMLANKLGLDVTEAGNTIATAMHWWQDGLINYRDTNGLDLDWGNVKSAIELMKQIAHNSGFGGILRQGLFQASDILAKRKNIPRERFVGYLFQSKGMTLRAVMEWRDAKGVALSYATSTRGADHLRGMPCLEVYAEWYGMNTPQLLTKWFGIPTEIAEKWFALNLFNRNKYEGKGHMVSFFENCYASVDALGLCRFISPWRLGVGPEEMAELTAAATGIPFSWKDIMLIGDRIWTLEVVLQRMHGLGVEGDYPPTRVFREPCGEGALKGRTLDRKKYTRMLREYYEIRGYNENGVPTKEKLRELGLENLIGKIGEH